MKILIFICLTKGFLSSLSFQFGISNRPGLGKEAKGGEDAFYANSQLLAVADGVGGWNELGIDPAKYSRKLIENVRSLFKKAPSEYSKNPRQLLIDAARANKEKGSSTLVVGIIDQKSNRLNVANIGDSGYAIFEQTFNGYRMVHRSTEQQHSFNFPYQIGSSGDAPESSQSFSHSIKAGDLIVMGSDGVFDNLHDAMIWMLVNTGSVSTQEMADMIVNAAYKLSLDSKYSSPFAVAAKKNGVKFLGGKNDDISVIVAKVIETNR